MVRYLTSYRFFVLSKAGIGLAYLWVCLDFLRINLALGQHLHELLPDLASEQACRCLWLNHGIIQLLLGLSRMAMIWVWVMMAPVAVTLYLWGRFRWLQAALGFWFWLSLVGMTARATVLMSVADFWLSWCFLLYIVASLITPRGNWETSHPALSTDNWRRNPTIFSEYAGLLVVLQFTVYFYAGINKLVQGWTAWTSGVAIQNLSTDLSVHDFIRGIHVPFWLSLILCYITLFQRLIVPFGFFIMRYRGWAVLILGSMHVGYDLLMQVALFPLIGVSSLLLIVPPRGLASPLFSRPSFRRARILRKYLQALPPNRGTLPQNFLAAGIVLLLVIEPAIHAGEGSDNAYLGIKLVTQAHWVMFADGGRLSRQRFRIGAQVHDPVSGREGYREIEDLPLRWFPPTWRTRFYVQAILLRASQASGEAEIHDVWLRNYINAAATIDREESPRPPLERVVLAVTPCDESGFAPVNGAR